MGRHWKKFPQETISLLFTAVEEDDVVEPDVCFPEQLDLRCSDEKIHDNYALCLQFWDEGFTREELLGLIEDFQRNEDLPESVRMRYKFIRARYKHLRFAQRLYGKKHTCYWLFHSTTVALGHFQDAFRNGNKKNLRFYGNRLRLLLSTPVWTWVYNAVHKITLETEGGFITYRQKQIRELQQMIATPEITGLQFHDVRKIVSQQVSFYDTLRSINPNDQEAYKVSRFLSAINGLMGDRHDEMVADKLAGGTLYDDQTPLDDDIRQRLEALVAHYPL